MTSSTSAAAPASMFEMNVEVERNIEKRATFSVVAVGEFAGFKLNCFVFWQKRHFRHIPLYRFMLCIRISVDDVQRSAYCELVFQEIEAKVAETVERTLGEKFGLK